MKDITILAIETSCDETAVAVVRNGNEVLNNTVHTQIDFHKQYGGVVPEKASRMHVEYISQVILKSLKDSNLTMDDIDGIAFTKGPGLIGSLHVGTVAAKTLAWLYNKPLIPVHHIYGHVMANNIDSNLKYPLLALIVSGGHTELIYFETESSYKIIGQTTDDAIGEAFDKVGRLMDVPYPGGVEIDKLSQSGEIKYQFKVPEAEGFNNFSFSGLKSSVLQLVDREKRNGRSVKKEDLAASFQHTAIKQLIDKTEAIITEYPLKQFVIAGGVAANSLLRKEVERMSKEYPEITFSYPQMKYCTDNAAMIGAAAYNLYKEDRFTDLAVGANPNYKYLLSEDTIDTIK